ncbi:large ribosomal subunit protein mL48 isoform X2 [Alligator mississippiensis]|uniref:Large ribosomal subunit protein mL48 n=1 Tax=Alligator mississippiensis TaxID=8496 RepID=A0A151PJ03_ALLMI|nr:large ribosomal subunit protein mL48 isoform X2 [Alligator mississippiensis]KYO49086.1 39S ribosomal protein L48, mitochondrial [Alligator mississippiensis]
MRLQLGQVLCLGKAAFPKQAFTVSRSTAFRENPICAVGGTLLSCSRHYWSQPTHGIGRFRHLVPAQVAKKLRERLQMKEINHGTDYEYGDLNIEMTAYDMCLVEGYTRYVHKLCNNLSIRVTRSYALPTKTTEVMLVEEMGTKMHLDAILTTHRRVIQITSLSATFAPILLEILHRNQPEGVHLLVKEHTEADFKVRFKSRPELEELMAKLSG